MQTITTIYALLFGLCFGSFANVLIYRLPRGESVTNPPSHCPSCNKRLKAADLIPVLSWLLLRRRCRYCRVNISWRYPVIEVSCAVLFLCMAFYTGPSLSVIPLCMFAFVLLCVTCVDIDIQEIPDPLLIFGAFIGISWVAISHFFNIGAPAWHDALLGALIGSMPLFLIDRLTVLAVGKDGFGFGDVKLMAMAGLFLGFKFTLLSLFFAVVAGGLYGVVLLKTHRAEKSSYFAFGPFLAAGLLAALWYGQPALMLLFP